MTDVIPGQLALDTALRRVEAGADPEWARRAYAQIMWLADVKAEFSSDHIWQLLGADSIREPRALGVVVRKALRNKVIKPTGRYIKTTRPEAHCRPIPTYTAA